MTAKVESWDDSPDLESRLGVLKLENELMPRFLACQNRSLDYILCGEWEGRIANRMARRKKNSSQLTSSSIEDQRTRSDMLAELLDESADPIFTIRHDGQYKYVNRAFAEGVNKTVQEIIGRSMWDVFPQDEADKRFAALSNVLQTKVKAVIEVRVPRADGDRYYMTSIVPVEDDEGRALSAFCSSKDITDRRRAEEALKESKKELELIIHSMSDIILVLDKDDCFAKVYTSMETNLLVQPDEFIGRKHRDVMPAELSELYLINSEKVRSTGKAQRYEYALFVDGDEKWFEANLELHVDQESIIAGIRGITERKKAEKEQEKLQEQLNHAQKMEAVGRLAGGVAHDFNNVLSAILGNAELIQKDLPQRDPIRDCVQEIQTAATRAADLTRQLLAFSRKQVIEPKVVDLSQLVESLLPMLGRLIGEDVTLRSLPQKGLRRVRVDPGQLEQIVVNLAVNARDAMPEGGSLSIETADVVLDESYCAARAGVEPGSYVMLAVSDTGLGMDEEMRSHIFEPFFTTKEQGKGTGLGLSMVRGAVKQNNGWIDVFSEPDQGTVFKLYFPIVPVEAEVLATPNHLVIPTTGTETILLVEDEPMVRRVAVRVLKRHGYKVLDASSASEALQLAERFEATIDLLLTDVVMPHMNGRELADSLLRLHSETKVLYTSGYTQDVIAQHGVLDEGVQFIAKPSTMDALLAKVREVLDECESGSL